MKIGAHVSSSGGVYKAIDRAEEIGAEAIQVFVSGPTMWRVKIPDDTVAAKYRERVEATEIDTAFFHGVYLINLGSPNPELVDKGVDSLIKYQTAADKIGCKGTIFHVGSHKGRGFETVLPQIVECFHRVLDAAPEGPWLIIENSAGMGQSIGSTWSEIGEIMRAVDSDRVRVCLDTQHSFANGYDVATKEGLDGVMTEFDEHIGLDNLVAVHANDSKVPFEGGLDRHENIGEGHIGTEGFEVIMAHPAFQDAPFLLEVPGFEGNGPDKRNVDTLKAMRGRS